MVHINRCTHVLRTLRNSCVAIIYRSMPINTPLKAVHKSKDLFNSSHLNILNYLLFYIKLFVSRHSNWSRPTPSRLSAISSAAYAVSVSVSVHCIRKVHENLFASAIFSTQGGSRYKNQQLPTAAADRLRSQSSTSSSSLYLAHGRAPPHPPSRTMGALGCHCVA